MLLTIWDVIEREGCTGGACFPTEDLDFGLQELGGPWVVPKVHGKPRNLDNQYVLQGKKWELMKPVAYI